MHSVRDDCVNWADEKSLVARNTCEGEVHIDLNQNISKFPELLVHALQHDCPPSVTFALDGLNFAAWKEQVARPHDILLPATTVVPSTSTTAWTSILSGTLPSDHGIFGAAFFLPEASGCYSLRHSVRYSGEGAIPCAIDSSILCSNHPTLFDRLKKLGYLCQYRGQPRYATDSPFLRNLANGADLIPLPYADELHSSPFDLVSEIIDQTRCGLVESRGRPLYQFNMINFDTYVHRNGYDSKLFEALNFLRQQIGTLQREFPKLCVAGISDHGMVRQSCESADSLLTDPVVIKLSQHLPGGAGRILFFYPRREGAGKLWEHLHQKLGGSGYLFDKQGFVSRYLQGATGPFIERIGDIVAVARTASFPSAMPSALFEHGGLTADEMIAGICFFGASS